MKIHIIKGLKLFLGSLMLLSLLNGCKLGTIHVGVSVYPVQYIVERIAQNKVQIHLISQGETITRATLVDDYAETIKSLNVFFDLGQLEPYMVTHLETFNQAKVKIIDLVSTAGVYKFQRYTTSVVEDQVFTVESPYYNNPVFDSIDTYIADPYLWLDPITMTSMASTIKDWLVETYPEEKSFFQDNFEALEFELANMDANYQTLWNKDNIKLVTISPSFGNWQKAYGLSIHPVVMSRYGVIPNAAQLREIELKILQDNVKYIVKEPFLSADMLALFETIKADLNLTEIALDNISFLSEQNIADNKNYMTLMYENLAVLQSLE